jgi:uncharacterized protein (TIGR00255 family)
MNSMTGFGTGRGESKLGAVVVELRTVNNRFLEVAMRLPQEFSAGESFARSELQKRLQRGKVYLNTRFEAIPGSTEHYQINESLLTMLEEFCRRRGENPSVDRLLLIPGVVVAQQDGSVAEELQELFGRALSAALDGLEKERQREGEALRLAMREFYEQMKGCLETIDKGRGQVSARYRDKLNERIAELLGPKGAALDPGRLEQEVAIFADKVDIQEEITRLRSHLGRLDDLLSPRNPEAKGRALDFLNQEILREINTIGSKARDVEITRQVLELKSLAESLKEQVANVE